jgi:hypothetical protein
MEILETSHFLQRFPARWLRLRMNRNSGPKQVIEKFLQVWVAFSQLLTCVSYHEVSNKFLKLNGGLKEHLCQQVSNPDDELAIVLQKAFMEDSSRQFIREIRTLREPAIVVCNDQQVTDLVRFCTGEEFGFMTVDPTFSLGDFDVTLMLQPTDPYSWSVDALAALLYSSGQLWYLTRKRFPPICFLHPH